MPEQYVDLTQREEVEEAPAFDPELSHPEYNGSYRVTDELAEWMRESVNRHSHGEQVQWDLGIMALPDESRPGMYWPGLVITMSIKGAIAHTRLYNTALEKPFGLTRELVDDGVRGWIEQMFQARSEQLAHYESEGEAAMAKGRAPEQGGLWTPGQEG